MSTKVSNEDLMRYLDDELDPDDRARVETAIETSTELAREFAIFRAIQNDVADLSFSPQRHGDSVWDSVNRKLTQPIGWILFTAGILIFSIYTAYVFTTSDVNVWEKVGVGGVVIGFLMLLASTVYERMREYKTDPYRHIER